MPIREPEVIQLFIAATCQSFQARRAVSNMKFTPILILGICATFAAGLSVFAFGFSTNGGSHPSMKERIASILWLWFVFSTNTIILGMTIRQHLKKGMGHLNLREKVVAFAAAGSFNAIIGLAAAIAVTANQETHAHQLLFLQTAPLYILSLSLSIRYPIQTTQPIVPLAVQVTLPQAAILSAPLARTETRGTLVESKTPVPLEIQVHTVTQVNGFTPHYSRRSFDSVEIAMPAQ
ncbi:hypothetical protein BT69DRAFT_1329623 [Atractiella rhizophila]|nr:hypothetical protein BT69DRAFT_1329623 [Atractiella rhizophila]